MKYILRLKMITDNLAAIEEPITEKEQLLQILGGLGSEHNLIVASLTAYEEYFFKVEIVFMCWFANRPLTFFSFPQTLKKILKIFF